MLNMGQRQIFMPVRKNKVILRCAPPETEENIESGGATTPKISDCLYSGGTPPPDSLRSGHLGGLLKGSEAYFSLDFDFFDK